VGKCGEMLPCTYSSHNHYDNLHVRKCYRINSSTKWSGWNQMLRMT